ncbi:type II toxin-antitoxin system Phd/YefM family antitoxin [Caballeronia cordobensis]|uniref:type II toxin-antitoxin system Phd/YefM family antitoxin n=1 Tax=Caballeronia cordobensis TaxID=1353886 RepID=UPI0009FF6DAA
MRTFNMHEAKTNLSKLIDETVKGGQPFVIAKAGRPLVKVVRIPDGQLKLPQFWSRKLPHRVKQDEVEFYSSFVFCARASAASLRR